MSTDSGEYTPGAFLWMCGVDGEVGAPDDADLDFGVDDEREADGVLFSSQEALRAVDRVDSPHS